MTIIVVDNPDNLKNTIETALSGTSIYLPDESFELFSGIHIPSGVTVIGRPDTDVTFSSGSDVYAFDLSGSTDSSLKNAEIHISNGKGGVYADNAQNVSVEGITISGNMFESTSVESACNIAIYITNSQEIEISNSAVFNGFGGIYSINNDNVCIFRNALDHTNFGQIVVSGDSIGIYENHVSFSGTPSENDVIGRQGDSFTSLGSTNLEIVGNIFDNPLCYQIAFWEGDNRDIYIANNSISNGITNAIYFATDTNGVIIEHNFLANNSEQGIFFEKDASNIDISENLFLNDGLMIDGHAYNIRVEGNNLIGMASDFNLPELVDSQYLINIINDNLAQIYYDSITSDDIGPNIVHDNPFWANIPDGIVAESGLPIGIVEKLNIDVDNIDAIQFYDGKPGSDGARISVNGHFLDADQLTIGAADISGVDIVSGAISDYQWLYVRALVHGEWSAWYSVALTTLADQSQDNVYNVRFPNDHTYESGPDAGGIDEVVSSSIMYRLERGVENLLLVDGALNGFGNDLGNVITGNLENNVLGGLSGDDIIFGGGGNDILYGGDGADDLRGGDGDDWIQGGDGADTLTGGEGADYLAGGLGDDVFIIDANDIVVEAVGEGTDTVRSDLASYTLGAQLENLVLLAGAHDGYGNNFANVITGNDAGNILSAGAGDDQVYGMAGDDRIWGDDGNDLLFGNEGNDILYGNGGADTLVGGTGDDIYVVEDNLDTIIEAAFEGTDTVYSYVDSYRLGNQLENLVLLAGAHDGYGNNFANVITGNDAGNILSAGGGDDQVYGMAGDDRIWGDDGNDLLFGNEGNDILYGNGGADTLVGGTGDDIYVVEDNLDTIIEAAFEGTDTVYSYVDSYRLGNQLENLVLLGGAHDGYGNNFANVITGNEAGNLLSGGDGNDQLYAGAGDDRVWGDAGDDTIFGQDGNDLLYGNDGNDVLSGGRGVDTLIGGAGSDKFVLSEDGPDIVFDFEVNVDKIGFSFDVSHINLVEYGAQLPQKAEAFLMYDSQNGNLYYDSDSSDNLAPILLATLHGAPNLTIGDLTFA
jgi:Ca2+-binding RTX toxin-like protein